MAVAVQVVLGLAVAVAATAGLQRLALAAGVPLDAQPTLEGFAAVPLVAAVLFGARVVALAEIRHRAPRHDPAASRATAWIAAVGALLLPAFAPGVPWAAAIAATVLGTSMVGGARLLARHPEFELSFEAASDGQRVWWAGTATVAALGLAMAPLLAASPPTDAIEPARMAAIWAAGIVVASELPAWYGRITEPVHWAQRLTDGALWTALTLTIGTVNRSGTAVLALIVATVTIGALLARRRHRHAPRRRGR